MVPEAPSQLFRRTAQPGRRVLLCGYYGEHNLGDDALLEVLLRQIPSGWTPLVTAKDQQLIRERFAVATTDRLSLTGVLKALTGCDALVLGGGSLLQDATSFRSLIYYAALIGLGRVRGLPIGLWGQGLGPLRRRRSQALVRTILPLASAITWRDNESASLAASWGVRAPVGSDPVWGLEAQPWRGRAGPIVLCWRPVAQLSTEGWRAYLIALDALAAELDRTVLWMPFHQEQDRGLLQALSRDDLVPQRLLERSETVDVADPAEAMECFRSASLVLAMRLHGLILAAVAGAPCAALSYDPKVAAAAKALGCPLQVLGDPVSGSLLASWRDQIDQPIPQGRVASLREQVEPHRTMLARLLPVATHEASR